MDDVKLISQLSDSELVDRYEAAQTDDELLAALYADELERRGLDY
jgi:hypothetical protein